MLVISRTLCQIYLFIFIGVYGGVKFMKVLRGAQAIEVWKPLLYSNFQALWEWSHRQTIFILHLITPIVLEAQNLRQIFARLCVMLHILCAACLRCRLIMLLYSSRIPLVVNGGVAGSERRAATSCLSNCYADRDGLRRVQWSNGPWKIESSFLVPQTLYTISSDWLSDR